ncbi:MAG: SDR family oxidoreductase [Bacteroidales bacterium]|jgi:short-subunit dehydrogenase|nr:SDR family oxidoreductase [Bacteroidales bacterium]
MEKQSYILLTGATSDIGMSIVRVLSADYPLLLHGRNIEKLEAVKNDIHSINPVELWEYDLVQIENIRTSLGDLLRSKRIQIGGFIHCAGTLKILPIKNFRQDYIQEIFNVNIFSAIAILQVLLLKNNIQYLKRIVFISSQLSKRGQKGNSIYASSKGAIDAFIKSLALELAPNINVNSILPGSIQTRMSENAFHNPEIMVALKSRHPIGYGECKDIALMVQYLLGEGGRWITAQNYFVDGGSSMF